MLLREWRTDGDFTPVIDKVRHGVSSLCGVQEACPRNHVLAGIGVEVERRGYEAGDMAKSCRPYFPEQESLPRAWPTAHGHKNTLERSTRTKSSGTADQIDGEVEKQSSTSDAAARHLKK